MSVASPAKRPKGDSHFNLWLIIAKLTSDLFQEYPRRFSISLLCLIISGLLEGVSLIALLPAVELFLVPTAPLSGASLMLQGLFEKLGIDYSFQIFILIFLGAVVLKAGFTFLGGSFFGLTVVGITRDLRLRLISGLSGARWEYHKTLSPGHVANTLSSEAQEAETLSRQVMTVLSGLIQTAIYLSTAFLISFGYTILSLFTGLLLIVLLSGLVRIAGDAGRARIHLQRRFVAYLVDWLGNLKTLKAMNLNAQATALLESQAGDLYFQQKRLILANQGITALQEPFMIAAVLCTIMLSLQFISVSMASIAIILLIFSRTLSRVNTIQQAVKGVAVSVAAYHGIRENIAGVEKVAEKGRSRTVPVGQFKEISLDNIQKRYGQKVVLNGLNLNIKAGEFSAILGPSGVGKTTILDLITGLITPSDGRVLLDGIDLNDIEIDSWRARIGYVAQEMTLLHDTVRVNLTLGDTSICDKQICEALQVAGAWNFVSELPAGIDEIVGERGQKFSGGQRQRLAIARALLRKPDILILDEATSALDQQTEQEILQSLVNMLPEITIVATSHRPAIKAFANKLIWLEEKGSTEAGDEMQRSEQPSVSK